MAHFSIGFWSQMANAALWIALWVLAGFDFLTLRNEGFAALGRGGAYRFTGNEAVLLVSAELLAGLLFLASFVKGLSRKNRILRRRG